MASDDLNPRKRRQEENPNPNLGSMDMNDIPQQSSNPQIPRELLSDANLGVGCSRNVNPQCAANREAGLANSGVSGKSRNCRHVHPARGIAASFNPQPGESSRNAPLAGTAQRQPQPPSGTGTGRSRAEVEPKRQRTIQAPTNPTLPNASFIQDSSSVYLTYALPPIGFAAVAYLPPPMTQTANSTVSPWRMQQQQPAYAYPPPQQIQVEGVRCFWCNRYLTSAPQGLSYHPRALPTPLVLMSCGHLFHEDCLRAHLRLHAIAPIPQSGNPPCPICWAVAPRP